MSPNDPSQQYILVLNNFFLTFTSILFEALPWVILGTALAGIVQEVPSRRAPAVMLGLSTLIVALFISPFHAISPGYLLLGHYHIPEYIPRTMLYALDTASQGMKVGDWLTKMYTDDPTWKEQTTLRQ